MNTHAWEVDRGRCKEGGREHGRDLKGSTMAQEAAAEAFVSSRQGGQALDTLTNEQKAQMMLERDSLTDVEKARRMLELHDKVPRP